VAGASSWRGGTGVAAIGWVAWMRGCPTFGYAAGVLVFLAVKVQREEKWVMKRFPGYAAYRRRVPLQLRIELPDVAAFDPTPATAWR
jgi:hypothetical protein